jgi:hypothetical protein
MKDLQRTICEKYDSKFYGVDMNLKVGIAIQTLHLKPIHAVRVKPENGTNGWYIHCGEYSDDNDFYKPLCALHLEKYCPEIIKYLALEPEFNVITDREGYEDVWRTE